ncbi:MAG: Holliday junction ATP-dependent DNA helicase RuvB [Phycisphaerales bacterium]|nr:MAG: Holliday junction ATP-dependent DNA helicase RuvB [Phycisphaerales bacterium]
MALQRVISPGVTDAADEHAGWALRPTRLAEYVGQRETLERLAIAVQAARARGESLDHVLLHGPPGLGKTTLAHVIAAEMGSKVHVTSGPALTRGTDLVAALTRLEAGDVLFIDEIHRTPAAVEEFVYPAMEDFRVDVTLDAGLNARTVQIRCKPFTLIGATTRAGLLSAPLRSRFGMIHHLRFYEVAELEAILHRSAGLLGLRIDDRAVHAIATRSRGTPRIANRLLRRVRDYAAVRGDGQATPAIVDQALGLEGVDALGLDELDRAYLRTIATTYHGGPVGLEALAATMNEDPGTLEDMVEPFLLKLGFVARHRRGRELTEAGAAHVGISLPDRANRTIPAGDPADDPAADGPTDGPLFAHAPEQP